MSQFVQKVTDWDVLCRSGSFQKCKIQNKFLNPGSLFSFQGNVPSTRIHSVAGITKDTATILIGLFVKEVLPTIEQVYSQIFYSTLIT